MTLSYDYAKIVSSKWYEDAAKDLHLRLKTAGNAWTADMLHRGYTALKPPDARCGKRVREEKRACSAALPRAVPPCLHDR